MDEPFTELDLVATLVDEAQRVRNCLPNPEDLDRTEALAEAGLLDAGQAEQFAKSATILLEGINDLAATTGLLTKAMRGRCERIKAALQNTVA